MKIAIIGSGHVGLVTGACFAELGNLVMCVDNDPQKITMLKKGEIPFFEPGLREIVQKNIQQKRLVFSGRIGEAVRFAKIIFLCVGTPPREDGEADLSAIEKGHRVPRRKSSPLPSNWHRHSGSRKNYPGNWMTSAPSRT